MFVLCHSLPIHFLNYRFIFAYTYMCMYVCRCPWGKDGVGSPGTAGPGSCEPPDVGARLCLGLLEEQQPLLTTKPSVQHPSPFVGA